MEQLPADATETEERVQASIQGIMGQLSKPAVNPADTQVFFRVTQALYSLLEPEHSSNPLQNVDFLFPGIFFEQVPILENSELIPKVKKVYFDEKGLVNSLNLEHLQS